MCGPFRKQGGAIKDTIALDLIEDSPFLGVRPHKRLKWGDLDPCCWKLFHLSARSRRRGITTMKCWSAAFKRSHVTIDLEGYRKVRSKSHRCQPAARGSWSKLTRSPKPMGTVYVCTQCGVVIHRIVVEKRQWTPKRWTHSYVEPCRA